MSTNAPDRPVSMQAFLRTRVLSGLVVLCLLMDGVSKLVPWSSVGGTMDWIGYGSSEALARALGLIGAAYSIPPTSILGAILWTGYLGDLAIAHLRIL
jgi:hypothetical protein